MRPSCCPSARIACARSARTGKNSARHSRSSITANCWRECRRSCRSGRTGGSAWSSTIRVTWGATAAFTTSRGRGLRAGARGRIRGARGGGGGGEGGGEEGGGGNEKGGRGPPPGGGGAGGAVGGGTPCPFCQTM